MTGQEWSVDVLGGASCLVRIWLALPLIELKNTFQRILNLLAYLESHRMVAVFPIKAPISTNVAVLYLKWLSYPWKFISNSEVPQIVPTFLTLSTVSPAKQALLECTPVMIEAFISLNRDLKFIQFFSDLDSSLVSECQGSPAGHTMEVPNWKKEPAHSVWHGQSNPVDYSGIILRNKDSGPGTREISYQNHILWRLVVADSKSNVFLIWERW